MSTVKGTYTASTAFFEALYEAGVRYCFVNLGSDHPAIVEAFVKGKNEGLKQPEIITCPHELKSGRNIKQMANRALSFASSDPKGPVHLIGPREVMEEEIEPYSLDQSHWRPIEPAALPPSGVRRIASALATAKEPLCIVGGAGRNHAAPTELVKLANIVKGMRVLDSAASDMSFPADHRAWLSARYGVDDSIKTADVILVLESDVPYIPTKCRPKPDATIYHIDIDPLKQLMPVFYIDAVARYRADSATALQQLNEHLTSNAELQSLLASESINARWHALEQSYATRLQTIKDQAQPSSDGTFGPSYLTARVRALCPPDTIWCVEAVTNAGLVADQIQATRPGSFINCGGGGLGWSGGAALGIKLAADDVANARGDSSATPFITQIVGDGTYLFSVPGTVYWISQRYNLPVLTIILNNKGWNAPRKSALLVHPEGYASKASNEDMNISFAPSPDYAGIAHAASGGKVWAGRARDVKGLESTLKTAVEQVKMGNGAVVDAQLEGGQGSFGAGVEGKQGG
ncbi:MAG: hypothetical protein Q9162_001855 [Coniocarpon cinnabarinum]